MKLSDTQRIILSQASQRDDRLAIPPAQLPAGARQKVAAALIRQGLVSDEHASAYAARDAWQIDGRPRLLRITDAGLRAIGIVPEYADVAPTAPTDGKIAAPRDDHARQPASAQNASVATDDADPEDEEGREDDRPRHERLGIDETLIYGPPEDWGQPAADPAVPKQALAETTPRGLKAAAAHLLAAWDGTTDEARLALPDAMVALRAALATKLGRQPSEPGAPRKPRVGTKQEAVLALLRRDEGATIAQICEATGWLQHTARGFLAALKKKGIAVTVLERVRQVGPGKEGARGSYSVYRAAG